MKRFILPLLLAALVFASCGKSIQAGSDEERAAYLKQNGVAIDTEKPYYSSSETIPDVLSTVWEMRNVFSKKAYGINISGYRGKQCTVYIYPILRLPDTVKFEDSSNTRAVVVNCKNKIICSYIDYVSELKTYPPCSLNGKSIEELSGIKWDKWKANMEDDDNQLLVILQYYDMLKSGDYDGAYSYVYDKTKIKKEDFINTARENKLPFMDFISIGKYKKSTKNESFYILRAKLAGQKKICEIEFNLKEDTGKDSENNWKIVSTKIR
ncbi:MAG: DUF4830 domain-containing protein [Clostridiales bacterium]|nr:DUF4830 domain-containing protein [Clostridiales bacterium]